jgi:hypothetical protein
MVHATRDMMVSREIGAPRRAGGRCSNCGFARLFERGGGLRRARDAAGRRFGAR